MLTSVYHCITFLIISNIIFECFKLKRAHLKHFALSLHSLSSVGRTLEDFKTSVTIAAHSKVTFELTYEELLQRRLGKYELLINAQPGQIVKDFKVKKWKYSYWYYHGETLY